MKLLLFSDLHVHKFNSFATIVDGMHSRVKKSLDVLDQLFLYARQEGIKEIFFGGDLFHLKGVTDTVILDLVYNKFHEVKDEFNFYFIPGNHDIASQKYTALETFKEIGEVFSKPGIVTLKDNTTIAMIPYMHSKKNLMQAIIDTPADILISHFGIIGAKVDGREINEGLSLTEAKKGKHKRVFLGHYHSSFCVKDKIVKFIGALLPMKFGDVDDRGFLIYDTCIDEYEFIKMEAPRFLKYNDTTLKDISNEELEELATTNYLSITTKKSNAFLNSLRDKYKAILNLKQDDVSHEKRLDIDVFDTDDVIMKKYLEDKLENKEDILRLFNLGKDIIERTIRE